MASKILNKMNKSYHDNNGDKMNNLLWDLFCKTGKIEYYIKYKEELRKKEEYDRRKRCDL